MDILLKAIPIAIPVILVILIFLMGYVKAVSYTHLTLPTILLV